MRSVTSILAQPRPGILDDAPPLNGDVKVKAEDLRTLLAAAAAAGVEVDRDLTLRLRRPLERKAQWAEERAQAAERERAVLRAAGYVQRERDLWSWEATDGPAFRISGMRRSLFEHHLQAQQCTHAADERVCEICSYLPRDRRAVA